MSRQRIARTGGNKPPLIPLPIDPVKVTRFAKLGELCKIAAPQRPHWRSPQVIEDRADMLSIMQAGEISVQQAMDVLGRNGNQARHLLRALRKDGLITHNGKIGLASRWALVKQTVEA